MVDNMVDTEANMEENTRLVDMLGKYYKYLGYKR